MNETASHFAHEYNREDMLELTRRMTLKRTSIDRIAGCYFDRDGDVDGSFNRPFLDLSVAERERNLEIAESVPFARTNENLIAGSEWGAPYYCASVCPGIKSGFYRFSLLPYCFPGIREMQLDIDEQKKLLNDYQAEVNRAKDANRQMDSLERQLSGAEWNLPEPSRFMSAREFFQKIALPLVNQLKGIIRSLYREVADLRSRLKGQEEFQEYKAKTTDYVMKLSTENQQLKEIKEAYDNIRSALGREECERPERMGQYQRLGRQAAGDDRMAGWNRLRQ